MPEGPSSSWEAATQHRPVSILDQAPSSRLSQSGVGDPTGPVQVGADEFRTNNHRPIGPVPPDPTDYLLQLTALRSPVAKGCALSPLCGPAHHSAERKAADESAAQTGYA